MAGVGAERQGGFGRWSFTSQLARSQYAAFTWVRFRIFANSLRTMRGSLELGAGIVTYLFATVIAAGPAVGLGFGAWVMSSQGHLHGISALLWLVFLGWQLVSAMAPALAGENPEMNHLLRYPVSFGSWVLMYLMYGLMNPSSIMGLLWCLAIWIGIGLARPDLLGWAALAISLFTLFNLLLSRAVLAWVERWMAQRRTREIVTAAFLFLALFAQTFNPAFYQHNGKLPFGLKTSMIARLSERAWGLQRTLPPGLASGSITEAIDHQEMQALEGLAGLFLWTVAVGGVLGIRLRAESLGENLSEAPRPSARGRGHSQKRGHALLDFSGPVAAVFEKDLRYLLRSGPMLYALAAPLVMVFLFSSTYRNGAFSGLRVEYALPLGLIWVFMGLTRMVSNNLGAEGEGIQFYFLSPTPLRLIVLGKNILSAVLFLVEAVLVAAMIVWRFGWPEPSVAVATFAWLLFAVPANFTMGNLLSLLMPYRLSANRMRPGRGSLGNGLLGAATQLGILAAGALGFLPFAAMGHPWMATPVLLILGALSIAVYLHVLRNMDRLAGKQQESLILEVMKTR